MDGKYHDHKLDAGPPAPRLTWATASMPPNTVTLPDGRIVNIGWMRENRPPAARARAGRA